MCASPKLITELNIDCVIVNMVCNPITLFLDESQKFYVMNQRETLGLGMMADGWDAHVWPVLIEWGMSQGCHLTWLHIRLYSNTITKIHRNTYAYWATLLWKQITCGCIYQNNMPLDIDYNKIPWTEI